MLDIKTLIICVGELVIYNILIACIGAWNLITFTVGTTSMIITVMFVLAKKMFGFYEDKQISEKWTFRVSTGITLFTVFMFLLLIKWRVS